MDAKISKSNLPGRLQEVLYDLIQHVEIINAACMTPYGLTVAQGYALLALPAEGDISMSDLSAKMRLAGSTMTRMVDGLLKKGLVERQHAAEDRRVVRVHLTESGGALRAEIAAEFDEFFTRVLGHISPEGRGVVVEALGGLMGAIIAVMKEDFGEDYAG